MENENLILFELRRLNGLLRDLPTAIAIAISADRRKAVAPEDRVVLDLLLQPIYDAVGEAIFSFEDLDKHAKLDPDLEAALRMPAENGLTRRKLGKLFARCAGVDINGIVIWHRGTRRGGAQWQLKQVGMKPAANP
jgi:hypothetical protein